MRAEEKPIQVGDRTAQRDGVHDADFVSVLMPAYNAERFIAEAIQSILSQTHGHFELIIVDDGSTDRTAQIVDEFATKDERVRLLSVQHGGISRALNAGLDVARGAWIARMDSDDVALPHRLERQLQAARQAPDVALWGSYARVINRKGKRFYTIALGPTTDEEFLHQCRNRELIFVIHPTWLARREVLVQAGGYVGCFDGLEDFELLSRVAVLGKIRVLPEELLLVRAHGAGITTNNVGLQRRLEEFLRTREDARREGRDLSLEAYTKDLAARPMLIRLREWISDVGRASYRQATVQVLEGRYLAAACAAVGAALLSPSHVLKRLSRRFVSENTPSVQPGYLVAVLAGGVGVLAMLFGLLAGLNTFGNLPPPAIANNICIDEKLAFLRDHPPREPTLLVIGSSVAWRHFDSEAVVAEAPGTRPLNGGFCGLRVNQTEFVANWLLDRLPTVREVVMIASPQDFETCTSYPAAVFDRDGADSFVFGQGWRWGYYFRYFDPISLVRNMNRIKAMRRDELIFTRYGDGPLVPTTDRDSLDYGEVRRLDGSCFAALRSMALTIASEGKTLMVVTTPLNPKWKAIYDPDASIQTKLELGILASLAGTGAKHWNGDVGMQMEPTEFTDAIHLRWSAVRGFSHAMVREFRLGHSADVATHHGEADAWR